jgi:beta-glucosidase
MKMSIALLLLAAFPIMAQELSTASEQRIDSLLGKMTIEEKVDLLAGVDFFYLRGVPRLGVPRMRMIDGPMGVRNDG